MLAIIITGQGDEDTAVRVLKDGASDYLVKDPSGMYLHLLPAVVKETTLKQCLRQEKESAEKERKNFLVIWKKLIIPADIYFDRHRKILTKRDQIKRKTLALRKKNKISKTGSLNLNLINIYRRTINQIYL